MKTLLIRPPENWQSLDHHPLAELTEYGAGVDVDALAEHMRQHGYDADEAIILFDGKILDGRHRRPAAIKAGVTPTFKQFTGDPVAYVTKKLLRQHLNESQRAMMAADLVLRIQKTSDSKDTPSPLSKTEAGRMLNVSRSSVQRASTVLKEGTPAQQQAVKNGSRSVAEVANQIRGFLNQLPDLDGRSWRGVAEKHGADWYVELWPDAKFEGYYDYAIWRADDDFFYQTKRAQSIKGLLHDLGSIMDTAYGVTLADFAWRECALADLGVSCLPPWSLEDRWKATSMLDDLQPTKRSAG